MRHLLATLCVIVIAIRANAHEGPPFPILMDEKAGPFTVSVWTDPDVGIGTFFVIFESGSATAVGDDVSVQVCVRPTSGRLEEACHQATRQTMRNRVQYIAEVPFDAQEMWQVRVVVRGPQGSGEVLAEVEATPPGYGAWDLAIYLFPFVLLAGFWGFGILRYRRRRSSGLSCDDRALEPIPG
jgi:hypothetical protein